ncbi:MAG: ribosome biogenesis GTPase YlqF [Mitsuaria chitosanitabida]|uniref:ribosome biogenesis GTPase YlqF n=1 Tax=Roseateles chitosanitabidus TaxID=65048 RepID=UPI001B0F904F|nr:ribosome biogenesis GTPase YlqF [Roseateles chitosanitabidus]MBO9686916.1 ribosome biogenesis GTPase YlqF [Roseateles chitosanitabidus]
MAIQWFPGHMHKTRGAIRERMKSGIDVVIEMLDARVPASSANPLLAQLTQGRPALKLLNKQDLADQARTDEWLAFYRAQPDTRAIAIHQGQPGLAKAIAAECRALAPNRGGLDKPLRVLICGIPNVGKSTLINTLVGKRAAATGDEPGITKIEQKILLDKGVYLFDTPGMLWPKIRVPEAGINLAASGAIGRNAFEEEVVALDLMGYLRRHYPQSLKKRYQLEPDASMLDGEVLQALGKRRGAVLSGGRINTQKAAEILLYDLRQGQLGRITLETPEEFDEWTAAAEAAEAAKEAEKEARRAEARRGTRDAQSAYEPDEGDEVDDDEVEDLDDDAPSDGEHR